MAKDQYTIISGRMAGEVQNGVNKLLREGWVLRGYLAVTPVPGNAYATYTQTLVKFEQPETI